MLKMKKVGPSMRAKDYPVRQDLRLEFAPALEALEVGEEGIQISLPDGMETTRFRNLINAVSNQAGYTVATELAYKTDKKGVPIKDGDGNKVPIGVNVYKTGTKKSATDEDAPPPKAKDVQVPDADDDENFDPLGEPDLDADDD